MRVFFVYYYGIDDVGINLDEKCYVLFCMGYFGID